MPTCRWASTERIRRFLSSRPEEVSRCIIDPSTVGHFEVARSRWWTIIVRQIDLVDTDLEQEW